MFSSAKFDKIYINGGRRGYLVGLDPQVLQDLLGATAVHCLWPISVASAVGVAAVLPRRYCYVTERGDKNVLRRGAMVYIQRPGG